MPIGIQLAHAGRKASTDLPWLGGAQIAPTHANGWQTVAPSALPFAPSDNPPAALDRAEMKQILDAFAEAARRAGRLGLAIVQIHAAHGYLLHQFLSPLSNRREDEYGGSLENRMRFPLEVFEAVRAAFPAESPGNSARFGHRLGRRWLGYRADDCLSRRRWKPAAAAAIHVSSGGLDPRQQIPVGPSYQVPLARAVKKAVPCQLSLWG